MPERASTAVARDPSVVLVSWDTVSAEHLALYGSGAQTPHLAALASRGVRYANALTHFPETSWSHWTAMTGAEPALHGNIPRKHDSAWPGPTLAERLRAAGYATGAFVGGVTLEAGLTGLNRGFDLYDDGGDPRAEPKRSASETTTRALDWISQQKDPFFAFVHTFDAHFPYEPPNPGACDPSYRGAMDGSILRLGPYQGEAPPRPVLPDTDLAHIVRLYQCEIAALDAALGVLLAGLPPETRVVLMADHGESFGHGYFFNHRAALTDEVLHVPLVVAPPPPGLAAGAVVDDQIGLSAVFELALGEAPAPQPVVATLTDPWEGTGLLSLRAGVDQAIWRVDPNDPARVLGDPVEIRRDDAPAGPELPSALAGALEAYTARISADQSKMRDLPDAAGPPPDGLQAIGYRGP